MLQPTPFKMLAFGCFLFFCNYTSRAQSMLAGRIFRKNSSEILIAVTVKNISQSRYGSSDQGGNYRIPALSGDTLVFSRVGYNNDTLIVYSTMLFNGFDIYLKAHEESLPEVFVDAMSKYRTDSLKRREDYAFLLDKKHPVKLWNEKRPGDAPGLNFSPIGFFSRKEKQKRLLKSKLKTEDEQEYIDAKFSVGLVAQLTRLTGDSLKQFIYLYRPAYAFCRKTDHELMLHYINEKLLLFRKVNGKKRNAFH
jgi:hypothetical protein